MVDKSILGSKSVGRSGAVFYENNPTSTPDVFNGDFVLGSIAVAFGQTFAGPIGMGKTLGDTKGYGQSSDVTAIEMGRGVAKVISVKKEECHE